MPQDLRTEVRIDLEGSEPFERWTRHMGRSLDALGGSAHAAARASGAYQRATARAEAATRTSAGSLLTAQAALARYAGIFAELNDLASLGEEAVARALRGMEDALVRFVSTGKLEFSSLANSIIADLTRIAIRDSITLPLAEWLGGLGQSGGGPGTPGWNPHVDHTGAFAHVPLRHGEGAFTPEQMRAPALAQPPGVRIEIINRGTPQRSAGASQASWDGRAWVVGVVTEDLATHGPLAQGLEQRYGLRRSVG